jgi:hypothetical protein
MLYLDGRLNASELIARFRALESLAAGKLLRLSRHPRFACNAVGKRELLECKPQPVN